VRERCSPKDGPAPRSLSAGADQVVFWYAVTMQSLVVDRAVPKRFPAVMVPTMGRGRDALRQCPAMRERCSPKDGPAPRSLSAASAGSDQMVFLRAATVQAVAVQAVAVQAEAAKQIIEAD